MGVCSGRSRLDLLGVSVERFVKETHPNLRAIVEASRGLGADESLVLHGGGNTSA